MAMQDRYQSSNSTNPYLTLCCHTVVRMFNSLLCWPNVCGIRSKCWAAADMLGKVRNIHRAFSLTCASNFTVTSALSCGWECACRYSGIPASQNSCIQRLYANEAIWGSSIHVMCLTFREDLPNVRQAAKSSGTMGVMITTKWFWKI